MNPATIVTESMIAEAKATAARLEAQFAKQQDKSTEYKRIYDEAHEKWTKLGQEFDKEYQRVMIPLREKREAAWKEMDAARFAAAHPEFVDYRQVLPADRANGWTTLAERAKIKQFRNEGIAAETIAKKFYISIPTVYLHAR
jgi:hypothetical protein